MSSKRENLIKRAETTVRQPRPTNLLEPDYQKKKGYKVVAISLYTPEVQWVEQTMKTLQRAGNPKANRSLVIREAILRLQEDLEEKNPEEVLQDFIKHQAKRSVTP